VKAHIIRRILAWGVDLWLAVPLTCVLIAGLVWIAGRVGSARVVQALLMGTGVTALVGPLLYFALFTGLLGKTPGKMLLRLHVVDASGTKPPFLVAVKREGMKYIGYWTIAGAYLAYRQFVQGQLTWYDRICQTDVEYRPRVRLTDTQRHFRDVYGDGR
jgi:uncharacterized RDD family membrane protein YckC